MLQFLIKKIANSKLIMSSSESTSSFLICSVRYIQTVCVG